MSNTNEMDFVYERDGFRMPIRAILEGMTEIEKEAFDAFKEQLRREGGIEELEKLESKAEFVSNDRIDMVGMHAILNRIAELRKEQA